MKMEIVWNCEKKNENYCKCSEIYVVYILQTSERFWLEKK